MFWHWFEPWGFMNTEPGKHESQFEALSQRLFGRTFWGDYGGDIISRYYYSYLLENYTLAVGFIEAAHGQGLVLMRNPLEDPAYSDQLREVIRFLAFFDPESPEYGHGEMWDPEGLSDWEWQLIDKEMNEGWWAEYVHGELVDHFSDWEDNTLVPDINTKEWGDFIWRYYRESDENYPYFEGADSLITPGFEIEDAADWLLAQYADSITNAGNPEFDLWAMVYGAPTSGRMSYAEVVAQTWNANRDI